MECGNGSRLVHGGTRVNMTFFLRFCFFVASVLSSFGRTHQREHFMRVGDTTMSTIEWALGAEAERQRVSANNIANINTPGFRSSRVDFESSLAAAMQSNGATAPNATTHAANTPQNINGNDVALEDETMILRKSSLHYDALAEALSMKFSTLRSAMGR